jgi:Cu+-exporting ATPase
MNVAIERSDVDFMKKQVSISFKHQTISLRSVAELLTSLGYEPQISKSDVIKETKYPIERKLLTQVGVTGFCAGNISLFSFPNYLGLEDPTFKNLFGYLNIILAT